MTQVEVVVEKEEVEQRTRNHWWRAEPVVEEKEEVEQRTRNHWWRAEQVVVVVEEKEVAQPSNSANSSRI